MQANYYCSNYLLHYQAKLYSWGELSFLRLNTISNMVLIKFSNSKFFFLSTVFVRLKEPLIVIIENILSRAYILCISKRTFLEPLLKSLKNMFYNTVVVQRLKCYLQKKWEKRVRYIWIGRNKGLLLHPLCKRDRVLIEMLVLRDVWRKKLLKKLL